MATNTTIQAQIREYSVEEVLREQGHAWDYSRIEQLHASSGTLVLPLPAIAPGDRFDPVSLVIEGMPFRGLLKNWSGVAVHASPQILDSAGAWVAAVDSVEYGFILDLGGMRSVLELSIPGPTVMTCVVPWLGTDFAPASLYPAHGGTTPGRSPDTAGTSPVALRGAQSQKLYVQLKPASAIGVQQVLDTLVVTSAVYPQNLRARIDAGDVFWTHPGELRGTAAVTGLHDSLNALAGELEVGARPNLVLETDAPGVLVAPADPFAGLVPEKGAEAAWAGSAGTTAEVRPGERIALPLIFADDGSGLDWVCNSLRARGSYEASPWRMEALETPQSIPAPMGLQVDAHFAAGRRFTVSRDTELHGLQLPLEGRQSSRLLLELQADSNGFPSGEDLASAELEPGADSREAWYEALFEEPLQLAAGQSFWALLKAREGAARWLATTSEISDSRYSEEGGAWSAFPPVYKLASAAAKLPQAMLRLLRLPHPEESDALLTLELPGKSGPLLLSWNRRKQDEALEWGLPAEEAPELPAPSAGGDRTLQATVSSLAGGSLELERVELFFHEKP